MPGPSSRSRPCRHCTGRRSTGRRCGGCGNRGCLAPGPLGLLLLALALALWLCRRLRCRARDRDRPDDGSARIPSWAYRQPDPMIYSQTYLMGLGYAVTWDNPDVTVEREGVPVDQHDLAPDTAYDVVARVWNTSTSGPAADLPVHVSYLDFGIGTVNVAVGSTTVDLPVKGAPGCPAVARVPWTTPKVAGHYCLQVALEWTDDAEPANNLGQSNTDVKALNSPRATFRFPLRNDGARDRVVRLELDAYEVPPPLPCDDVRRDGEQLHRRHDPAAYPVPEGWVVEVTPREAGLGPGETTEVTVEVTAVDGFLGRQAFNVHALDGRELLGGVTLTVEGTG